jgi:hypothetical protein
LACIVLNAVIAKTPGSSFITRLPMSAAMLVWLQGHRPWLENLLNRRFKTSLLLEAAQHENAKTPTTFLSR